MLAILITMLLRVGNAPKLGGEYLPLNVTEESGDESAASKVSKEQERKHMSSRAEEVKSDSDTSDDDDDDDDLMVQYGAKRVSSRRKEPQKVQTDETDENEIALAMLGNRSKKRALSLSKGPESKKSRRRRDSDSEDSDEVNIVCELCNKKIPKELYQQHVDEELEERKRASKASRKVEGTPPYFCRMHFFEVMYQSIPAVSPTGIIPMTY